jgi:hypothetical protein
VKIISLSKTCYYKVSSINAFACRFGHDGVIRSIENDNFDMADALLILNIGTDAIVAVLCVMHYCRL